MPNAAIADSFRGKGWGDKTGLWSRGVDRDLFTPARRSLEWRRGQGYGDDEVVLLFFGRLVLEKGLAVFAAAVDALRARGHRVRPLVVGDGPALDWFRERLGEAVFTGHLDGAGLGEAVASADILINPSDTEAFGNVNLEAMASGLAVVSADVPSASALIEPGRSGILVPPRDALAYARAAERLILDESERRRLGQAALDASREYVWSEVLRSVLDAYRRTQRPAAA